MYNARSEGVVYIITIRELCWLKLLQVYAHKTSCEEDVELFCDCELSNVIEKNRCQHRLIISDSNLKINKHPEPSEHSTGKFGLGNTKERGQILSNFLEE